MIEKKVFKSLTIFALKSTVRIGNEEEHIVVWQTG